MEPILSELDTDALAKLLIQLIEKCDAVYFAPLTDKTAHGCVDHADIARINRVTAELTSRYLLSGF